MSTYKENLTALIAAETGALTAERVAQLSEAAQTLAKIGVVPPKPKAAASLVPTDPIVAARARYAELQTQPLPRGATETMRIARANENAALLSTITGRGHEDLEANGGVFSFFQRPTPPDEVA